MTNVYRIARSWRYITIGSCVGLVLIFFLPVFLGNTSSEFIWSALLAGGISGVLAYGVITSRIITSPKGVESISFGLRAQGTWDKVEKVDINPYGFVNLMFRETIYKNRLVNGIFRPLAYNRTIQLSPYIEDLSASNLLRDIEKYVPDELFPSSMPKHRRKRRSYQRVAAIGLYYLAWLIVLLPFSILIRGLAEDLAAVGLSNVTLVSEIMSTSLTTGILIGAAGLLGYNKEISELDDSEILYTARAYYLNPIVALLLGFTIGIVIWMMSYFGFIAVSENNFGMFSLVGIVVGAISMRMCRAIERSLFQDKIGR
jgi:hypothetical protein